MRVTRAIMRVSLPDRLTPMATQIPRQYQAIDTYILSSQIYLFLLFKPSGGINCPSFDISLICPISTGEWKSPFSSFFCPFLFAFIPGTFGSPELEQLESDLRAT